ncbi:hypothetical protein NBRC111894_95 [Sporolactobacillus inulinus]|uniref:Uncharacterized protein n=1 Tax=Sporolactobacillus inulinus TaxID=2078 RepID=A0A4Y1Z6L2_9BACL|nr:hypothetical protein NBRC111894_95 [Sporolactobacillus inulinus]
MRLKRLITGLSSLSFTCLGCLSESAVDPPVIGSSHEQK